MAVVHALAVSAVLVAGCAYGKPPEVDPDVGGALDALHIGKEIQRLGGWVVYGPGADGLPTVQKVSLSECDDVPAALALVVQLDQLGELSLWADDRLVPLVTRVRGLRILRLGGKGLTDEGVKQLEAAKHIEYLNLSYSDITDAGLRHLAALPVLKGITLEGTSISDDGVKALQDCEALENVDVEKTAISDAGLEQLVAIPRLRSLVLGQTKITDQGLRHLRRAGNLTILTSREQVFRMTVWRTSKDVASSHACISVPPRSTEKDCGISRSCRRSKCSRWTGLASREST